MRKTALMRRVEERLGQPLEEAIVGTYNRLFTLKATGQALGINPCTLYVWMLYLGLTRKVTLTRHK